MSRTFSINRGSFDNLRVSVRCGRQKPKPAIWAHCTLTLSIFLGHRTAITCTSIPVEAALSVPAITRSTSASRIVRGAPGARFIHRSPQTTSDTCRPRHFPTVSGAMRKEAATAELDLPAAQARTIPARRAKAWAVLRRLIQLSKVSRSSNFRSSGETRMSGSHDHSPFFSYYIECLHFIKLISDSGH